MRSKRLRLTLRLPTLTLRLRLLPTILTKLLTMRMRLTIRQMRLDAADLIERANAEELTLMKQTACDSAGHHVWVDGGGGCGGRFVDKCKNCGWEHTS